MTCEICQDDYGMSWCESDCLICYDCVKTLENCPKCKCKMSGFTHFLAGKIIRPDQYPYLPNKLNKDEKSYEVTDRRIVATESNIVCGQVNSRKAGAIKVDEKDIISREDFINLSQKLPRSIKIDGHVYLSGPCIILNEDFEATHGCWGCKDQLEHIADSEDMMNVTNHRNSEMIENCDVFTLTLSDELDCYRSIAEWGIALRMGKIMILNIEIPLGEAGEFYLFASDSLHSLKKLPYQRREAILRSHPLNKCGYKQYKLQMECIIKSKKKRTEVISRAYEDYETDVINE